MTVTGTRHFFFFITLFFWVALGGNVAIAQTNDGLPGGPVLGGNFQNIEKISTICDKCEEAETAFHGQVDRYDATRAAYEAQLRVVREKADAFLEARADHSRSNSLFEELSEKADDLLFNRDEDQSIRDYYDARDARDEAEPDAIAARQRLDQTRAALDAALRRLENLRSDAVAEMRAALRLQSAMHQCELACDVEELDLDEPAIAVGPTADLITAADIPVPENFIGIVAKCAKCQPLAEQVNTVRAHRRSFAVTAQSVFESLTANRATLDRLRREAIILKQQEQDLFQQLMNSFTAQAPGEDSSAIDRAFDEGDQRDAEQALRKLAQARSQNARDRAGLAEVIAQQQTGLQNAIANYHVHSALLAAAQQKLAACEVTCKTTADGSAIGDPFVDPDYPQPENVDPILAECPKCQPIADELVQVLSERRRVASDIQDEVWLLKGRRQSLERWEAELDKLDREERQLGRILLMAYDPEANATVNERAILDRLFEIEDAKTRLTIDLLWAEEEISRLEKQIQDHLAEHTALTARAAELRAQLAACEETCGEEENGEVGLGGGLYDPAYPEPVSFIGVVAECAECQPLAEQLNALLSERYRLASDIQSTVARLKYNRPLLEERRGELAGLLEREEELNPIWAQPDDTPERRAATKELNQIDLDRRRVEADIAALEQLNTQDEAALEAMLKQHAELNQRITAMQVQLAACEEEKCKAGEDGSLISLPGQDRFVTTDCPPCAALASMVNDAVGTLIGVERELEAAHANMAALNDAESDRETALADVLAREAALNEEWLTTADADRQAEIDEELHDVDAERNRLNDERDAAKTDKQQAQTELEAAQARVDELTQMVADLKAQLAECEKQCEPGNDDSAIAIPGQDRFVTTDCPPCEALASMVNDAVGTLIGAERELEAAKERAAALQAASTARAQALEAVLTRESALNEEWLTTADAERKAEIDAELHDVDAERNRLTDEQGSAETEEAEAQSELEAAQARVDELTQMVADLKAQLAECEKQCAPGNDGPATAMPDDSPFVTTDCEPCAQIASLLNDVIGSIQTTEAELAEATGEFESTEAEIAGKEAEKTDAQDAFAEAMVEKANLEAAGKDASAQTQTIDENIRRAADLLTEIEDLQMDSLGMEERVEELQSRLAELKAQEQALRAQLEECEKQCAADDEEAAMSTGGETATPVTAPGFVLTKLQPETCTGGAACSFEITATNQSQQTLTGPLFIFDTRRVQSVENVEGQSELHCSSARGGQSLCVAEVEAAPGTAFNFSLSVGLPRRVREDDQNCVYLGVATDDRVLNQMIQAGLAARGFKPGTADGIPGRRTRAAIASFAADSGLEFDQSDPVAVFRAMFGTDPVRISLGHDTKSCTDITATPAPPAPRTNTSKPPAKEEPKPRFRIIIDLGIFGGSGTSKRPPRETEVPDH